MRVVFSCFLTMSLLTCFTLAPLSQNDEHVDVLTIDGHPGRAEVIRTNGRTYVDLKALAEMVGASVSFRPGVIVLTLPTSNLPGDAHVSPSSEPETRDELSHNFSRAGIEAIATIREWVSTLAYAIENNYGVTEDWVAKYRQQAEYAVGQASSAISTDADRKGLELLRDELETVRLWSDKLVDARRSMSTAKYATSPGSLRSEELSQKIISCGHFLASMFGSSTYQDDPSCR
jgi:hypothetical protein